MESSCNVRGEHDDYRVLRELDRETARRVTAATGIPIPFPPGVRTLQVVTGWNEDPRGKLALGQGQSSVFCLGQEVNGGKFVGLKVCADVEGATTEHQLHSTLVGIAQILQPIDFALGRLPNGQSCAIQVVELGGLGSLKNLLPAIEALDDEVLRERLQYLIAEDLLRGLRALHAENLFHLDVKRANVVVTHRGKVKLIDFDCAKPSDDGLIDGQRTLGDLRSFPPERWLASTGAPMISGAKVDAFGAGLTLWGAEAPHQDAEMIMDRPFEDLPSPLRAELAHVRHDNRLRCLEELLARRLRLGALPKGGFGQVLRGLLSLDPSRRLTVDQALDLPWFGEMERRLRGHRATTKAKLKEMVQQQVIQPSSNIASPQQPPLIFITDHVHRRELQQAVRDRLLAGERQTILRGLPGMGKSHLARFIFAHEPIRDHFGLRLWFRDCTSGSALREQMTTLAIELGIGDGEESFNELLRALNRHLQGQPKPWLALFDGLSDPQLVDDLHLPGNGQLLITSSGHWANCVEVGPLSRDDGRRLVEKLVHQRDFSIDQLLKRLAYNPQAVVNACAWIRRHGSANELVVVGGGPSPCPVASSSVWSIYWRMFDILEGTQALDLFYALACFASQDIPIGWIRGMPFGDETLGTLTDYALIIASSVSTYRLPEVPREAALARMTPEQLDRALRQATDVVTRGCDAYIITHCRALLALTDRLWSPRLARQRVKIIRIMIQQHLESNEPRMAEPLVPDLLRFAKAVGDDDLYAECLVTAADAYSLLGDGGDAIWAAEKALRHWESSTDSATPTLARYTYGIALLRHGRLRQAIFELEQAIWRGDPKTVAACRGWLGVAWDQYGDVGRSLEQHKMCVSLSRALYGEKSLQLATPLFQLGSGYIAAGRFGEASKVLSESLAIVKANYGDRHPKVGRRLLAFADCRERLGTDPSPLRREALEIFRSAFGEIHSTVAHAYQALGDHPKAVAIAEQMYARGHRKLSPFYRGLGTQMRREGRLDRANELHQRAYDIADEKDERRLALEELSEDSRARGDPVAAGRLCKDALGLASEPSDVARLGVVWGEQLLRKGKFEQAAAVFWEAEGAAHTIWRSPLRERLYVGLITARIFANSYAGAHIAARRFKDMLEDPHASPSSGVWARLRARHVIRVAHHLARLQASPRVLPIFNRTQPFLAKLTLRLVMPVARDPIPSNRRRSVAVETSGRPACIGASSDHPLYG